MDAEKEVLSAIEGVSKNLGTLNQMVKVNSDATNAFTKQVHGLVDKVNSNQNIRTSLDFEFQKKKRVVKKDGPASRYTESSQIDEIKMKYADSNELMDFEEVRSKQIDKVKTTREMQNIREQAQEQMQLFQNV